MNTFKIFIKADKFVYTRARISFGLFCLILIFACCIEKKNYPEMIYSIIKYSLISLLIFGVINSFFNRQLKGKLYGELKFNFDNITVNNKIYPLDEIRSIKIYLKDYNRKYIGSVNPLVFFENFSNGTNNQLILILNSGEVFNINFQRKYSNEIISVHESLRNYLDQGKLSRKNYDEITQ